MLSRLENKSVPIFIVSSLDSLVLLVSGDFTSAFSGTISSSSGMSIGVLGVLNVSSGASFDSFGANRSSGSSFTGSSGRYSASINKSIFTFRVSSLIIS